MCENVKNKTNRRLLSLVNKIHCEPAQAGLILSTHKFTNLLENFSNQTHKQYISNKEMMVKSANESTKQFWITTCMTVLVIILTIINIVPAFNGNEGEMIEKLESIEMASFELDNTIGVYSIDKQVEQFQVISEQLKILDSINDRITHLEQSVYEFEINELNQDMRVIKQQINNIEDSLIEYIESSEK